MAVDGIRNNQTPVISQDLEDLPESPSTSTLVQTTSLQTQRGVLLGQTSNTASSEIPNPSSNPNQRLEEALYQLEQLQRIREQLAPIAPHDHNAADLVAEIDRLMPVLEQEIAQLEQTLSSDIDGDGVYDAGDPDRDGDMITNERELRDGTNPDNADSDGDGITDDNEIRIYNLGRALIAEGHVEEGQALMRRGNALSGDGDRDGILDSAQLNDEIRVQLGMESATEGAGGAGSSGVGAQSTGSGSSAGNSTSVEDTSSPFENLEPESRRQTSQGVHQMTFEMNGANDFNFRMMDTIAGQEAKQWTVNADGDNLIVEAKSRQGEVIGRFILEDGNTDTIRAQLQFHLHDSGQRLDSSVAVSIYGGSGDDLIYSVGGAGSQIYGQGGNDMVVIEESVDGNGATIDGGAGNDILQGGDATDRISGGEGNDFIYGALGENVLLGQGGNDAIFTAHNDAGDDTNEVVEGGTGIDLSNAFNGDVSSIETGIDNLNGLITYLNRYGGEGASPIELEAIQQAMEEDIPMAMSMMSEGLESLALEFLIQKDLERQSWYVPLPGSQDYSYETVADTENPPTQQYQNPEEQDDFFLDWGQ
ncbi:MAG: hypothetical protein HYT76_10165 [Deltaproteobacteria bacterium]|nr:hypothetical protein [Deltaproteobacteria bacterium]